MPLPLRPTQNRSFKNQDFANQDLTGEDFSLCDIHGCNFSGATLIKANFQEAVTGQSQSQVFVCRAIVVTSIVIIPFAVVGAFGYTAAFDFGRLLTFIILFALPILFINIDEPFPRIKAGFVISVASAFAVISALGSAVAIKAISVLKEVDFLHTYFLQQDPFIEGVGYSLSSLIILGLGVYAFLKLLKLLRNELGTHFNNADLSRADFTNAVLQNADFSNSILDCVNWEKANFYRCKFPNNFIDVEIRELCISRKGAKKDFCHADLSRLYLKGVDLAEANLVKANLIEADLSSSNLENADLSNIQALGADFTGASLTGACIYNWGINSETIFTDVQCDYIYLEPGQQERKPASGSFEPGDFEKLVHYFTKTLDFLLRRGVSLQLFHSALQSLPPEYKDAGLPMHSITSVGDGEMLITLHSSPDIDKRIIYEKVLQSLHKELAKEKDRNRILDIDLAHAKGQIEVYTKLEPRSLILVDGDYMEGNKVQVTGTGDISGISGGNNDGVAAKNVTGAAVGNMSDTLSISIGKLELEKEKDPEIGKLANLLKQLKDEIEKDNTGLSEEDQRKALKHLDVIAQLGTDRKNPDLLEKAGDALDALPTILKRGEGLKEFVEKYLPTFTTGVKAILSVLGIQL